MENPATWGKAERVVGAAYEAWTADRCSGKAGLSLIRQITDALRAEGLLKDG